MNPAVLMADTDSLNPLKSKCTIWTPLFSSLFSLLRDLLYVNMTFGFTLRLENFSTSTML